MKKNAGFSVAGIAIVVVAVLVVGAVVWRVYDASKNKPANNSSATSHQAPSHSGTAGPVNSSTPLVNSATYLDIKELGVKVTLDNKTNGVTYSAAQSSNDEAVYIIDPSMKTLDQANQYCSGVTAGMIGLLDRSKDATHWGETPIVVDNVKSFKVGDYYYLFRGSQSECSQDSTVGAQRASHEQDFVNVLKSIQIDN